jgi:uncharacterized protein
MKRLSVFLIILSTLVFLFPVAGITEEKIPQVISIGTHSIGSFFHTTGTAAAKVITDHTKIRAIVKPMAGPVAWYPYMERGEIELGVLNMWDAEKGYLGESLYERLSNKKGFSVRLLCPTVPNAIGLVVTKDSPIKNISDLKGKKVSGNFPTPSLQLQTEALLANGNLGWKDIIPVPSNSPAESVKMVTEGRSDSSGTVTLGTPAIDELNAKKGARFVPLDPSSEAVARMKKFFPGYMVKVKPGPGHTGIEGEQYLWAYDTYLIVSEKLPVEAVHLITKTLWENYTELEKVHKLLKGWTPGGFVSKHALIPYHPGAISFYKEKGAWDTEMERLQKDLLEKKK